MNYISLLTQEEKSILCKMITGKAFKELFKQNEQEFSRIRKGFRAKSLTEQQALSIATANIDKPFIAAQVNAMVDIWLREIRENIAALEAEGVSHNIALATTLLDSFFENHIELYFKLTENPIEPDAYAVLYKQMEKIKSERAKDNETADRIQAMEEENRHLSVQIAAAQQSMEAIKTEYEEKVRKIERDKNELASLLAEAQTKLFELQSAPKPPVSDDTEYLEQFDDTNISMLPSASTEETVSLCCVFTDYNSQKCLKRYADLNYHGRYYLFRKNEDSSPYFTNRGKIFFKDGPSIDGFYGIWTWSAVPNENDPSKDYIQSRYTPEIGAIEIATITDVTTLDDLITLLKAGITFQLHSRKIMFSIYAAKGQYTGILCTPKDLDTVNGKITISEECVVVPVYEFSNDDIMRLDNGLLFYRNAFAGLPSRLYHLKTPLEIVKGIVFSSISWSSYKARHFTHTEFRAFKDFLDAFPIDDITSKIETACRCSNSAAKELLDDFLNIVWKYVDGDSLEDEIILSAISANTKLQEKTKALIRKDWEAENESMLTEAHKKLDSLHAELKSTTEHLIEVQEAIKRTKAEETRLASIIVERETLAEDVEKGVAERIQKARDNAAEFIASMAFVGRQPAHAETSAFESVPSKTDIHTYHVFLAYEKSDELEAHHSWADVMNTAISELAEAGVAKQYRNGLAAFLCAAYIEKQPILLVGPNAIDIAQAFSAAVTAQKYGLLCCEGTCTSQLITEIGANDESIVIVNNLLASGWINRLPEIFSKENIFYMATHPYAEDIQVEPQSLYSFMLPVFTEFIVDRKATKKYCGGYFAEDFVPYSAEKTAPQLAGFSRLTLSPLVRSQINRLVNTMQGIYPAITADDKFLFCIFPIAYASMRTNELTEAIAQPQNGTEISASLKRDLRCVLGDI